MKLRLNSLSPATLTSLDGEIAKLQLPAPTRPSRQPAKREDVGNSDNTSAAVTSPSTSQSQSSNAPRANIGPQIAPLIPQLSDPKWQVRKEAMDAIGQLLVAGGNHVQCPSALDLLTELRSRLADSNKNLVAQAAELLGATIRSLGWTACERVHKTIFPPWLACLNDAKPQVRQACLRGLTTMLSADGIQVKVFTLIR